MRFGFFKKKGEGDTKKDSDLFDPTHDDLDFDELEESGEFLSDENYDPPPPPTYQPPVAEAPRRQAPPTPGPSKLPPATPAPQPGTPPPQPRPAPPIYDDLTVVNRPPLVPPQSAPPAPGSPLPPANQPTPATSPAPPAPPPAAPARSAPRMPPPRVGDDDVTMILSAPVGEESVVAWLVVASEPGRGRDFRLPGGMARIGIDAGCEIHVDFDSFVSSRHAEISYRNGQYHLRDLNSTNGSFVNESRITETALNDNDRVRLGQTTFIFKSLNL